MNKYLAVSVDGQVQLEFDHDAPVPPQQLDYLDHMDARMDAGIVLDGKEIASPDKDSRVKFVAQNLANALMQGNERMAMAMCTWIGVRQPALLQLKITTGELGVTLDLDYENPYQKPEPQPQVVHFHPNKLNS